MKTLLLIPILFLFACDDTHRRTYRSKPTYREEIITTAPKPKPTTTNNWFSSKPSTSSNSKPSSISKPSSKQSSGFSTSKPKSGGFATKKR